MRIQALGLIETFGFIAAVEAADICLKSANVKIIGVEPVSGGLVTVKITGDVGAVKASLDASRSSVEKLGCLISAHIIPKPAADTSKLLWDILNKTDNDAAMDQIERTPEDEADFARQINDMKVVELRTLARQLEGIAMERRHIKYATRKELLGTILEYYERKSW